MMRFLLGTVLALAGCRPSPPATPKRDLRGEVTAAAQAFDDAQLRRDRAALELVLAKDMVFVRGSGRVTGRDDFLATFTSPDLELAPYVITNRTFVALGDHAALVGGEAVMSGKEKGEPFSEHFRYSDIFAWRDGRWQCVHVQVTMIPAR
jgi:ketosteroid isomerase-like protein